MWFIVILTGLFFIVTAIMPWVNRARISDLERQIEDLESIINNPDNNFDELNELADEVTEISSTTDKKANIVEEAYSKLVENEDVKIKEASREEISEIVIPNIPEKKKESSFELNFGAKLPVWIGGIALAFAGFYLVKYSIDTGLLNPLNRVILGVIFGIGLVLASFKIMSKRHIANTYKISQSVAGAGIIVLYISIYASTEMYNFLGSFTGFTAMAGITFGTIFLSLKNGLPIAFMSLIGGFLTPLLISSSNPSSIALFSYLFVLFYGLTTISKKQNWWILSTVASGAILLMVLTWIFGPYFNMYNDPIVFGLFLMAVSTTLVIKGTKVMGSEPKIKDGLNLVQITNYATLTVSAILMGIIVSKSAFGIISWGMYGLMTIGGLFVAKYNEKHYGFIPWVLLAVNLITILNAYLPNTLSVMPIIISSLIFIVSGYYFMFRSEKPINWAALTGVSSALFYMLAYIKLENLEIGIPMFWGYLGLGLASIGIFVLKSILDKANEGCPRDYISGVFATSITAIITTALAIEMNRNFLPIAIAGEIFAISLINLKVNIKALRYITLILSGVFALLLTPQILLLIQLSAYSLLEVRMNLQKALPLVNQPIIQLGIPAAFFTASCILLSKVKYDKVVYVFEIVSVALIGTMGYYLTRNLLHPDLDVIFIKAGFYERGLMTNIFFVFGLGCLFVGRKYARQALSLCGVILASIAVFRLGYFDLFIHNPLWNRTQLVGENTIFNSILLTYGLPIIWCMIALKEFYSLGMQTLEKIAKFAILILFMALVTLEVRQFFHGNILVTGASSNAEIYSYSVAWILSGIIILVIGFIKENKMMRISSLAIMIISVAKVFLYDASELEGLLRVISFFGLGVSLLGLSYFYTRFVFRE